MRPPAPRQVVLAGSEIRAEYALSAVPVPGIKTTAQKNTKLVYRASGKVCIFPAPISLISQGARLERSALTYFAPNMGSSHWVAILIAPSHTT